MSGIPRFDARRGVIRRLRALCLGLLCLTGCQTAPEPPTTPLPASRTVPAATAAENTVRYQILADRSDIRFLVFRAGPMARLGHNHVVQAKNIRGEIRLAPDIGQSSFFIELPVKDFQVDAEGARLDEGAAFQPQPDDEAIAGTVRNMLGEKVLDADKYPTIEIRSLALNGPAWGMDVTLSISLHGVTREMVVPTAIESSGEQLVVTAFFAIKQSDFGIAPMSVFSGALRVDDTVKVRLRIVASKGGALPKLR